MIIQKFQQTPDLFPKSENIFVYEFGTDTQKLLALKEIIGISIPTNAYLQGFFGVLLATLAPVFNDTIRNLKLLQTTGKYCRKYSHIKDVLLTCLN
jgi:hypothetical protein